VFDDHGTHLSVTPRAHPDKIPRLAIEWKYLTNGQTLESAVQVPNYSVTTLGSMIQGDDGAKKERLMLVQAAIK